MEENRSEAPPAVVTSLGYPELAVTVETMGGHVVGYPPRDLHRHTHTHPSMSGQCIAIQVRERKEGEERDGVDIRNMKGG